MDARSHPRALWGDEVMYADLARRLAAGQEARIESLWPPAYPAFPATNTARRFTGPGLTVREADLPKTNLRFQTGDAIA